MEVKKGRNPANIAWNQYSSTTILWYTWYSVSKRNFYNSKTIVLVVEK